jgi:hypothetical protein
MLAILTPEQQATINKGFSALHRQPEAILALLEQQGGLTADASAYLAEYAKRALEPREPRSETPPKTTADLAKIIHANEHLKEDDLRQSDIGALRQAIAALPTEDAKRSLLILSNRAREEHFYEMAATQVPFLTAEDPQAIKVVSALGANWAHHDPQAATAWIETLPSGELKVWALEQGQSIP